MEKSPEKVKILYVITKSNFGGAQKYVYDLASSLPHGAYDVAVALGGHGILIEKLHAVHVRTIPIPSLERDVNILGDIRTFFALLRIFKKERPAVVHLNSSKIGVMGGIAARLAGIPRIIFTAHGWAFNENRSPLSQFVIKTLSWITVLLAHKTIAVSEAIARDMQWIGAPSKMALVKTGIRPIDFLDQKGAREFLNNLSPVRIPPGAFIFGTIAELHPSKGLTYAIEAFSAISEKNPLAYYIILGSGEEYGLLSSLISSKNLTSKVLLLGFVDNAAQYLKAFNCFMLPSTTEALGLVLLEAGLAKIPVVASNCGGIPEIIEDQRTGLLVPPKNSKALALALFQILESPTTCAGLAEALNKKVLHSFLFETTLSATLNLYNKK